LEHLEKREFDAERRRRIQDYLDLGHGVAWMKDLRIAGLVENALLYFDNLRYKLPAWVVMPNHVHALVIPATGFSLESIVHSWKSFTSKEANKKLNSVPDPEQECGQDACAPEMNKNAGRMPALPK
jgi:hypothetical protein